MSKRNAAIYRRAAQLLERGVCSYWGLALDYARQPNPGGDKSPLQDRVEEMFELGHQYATSARPERDHAILALCFMAAIEESGG